MNSDHTFVDVKELTTRFETPQGSLFIVEHEDGSLTIGAVYIDGEFKAQRMTLDKKSASEFRRVLARRFK